MLSGVHYRFDVDKGLQIGRTIAARALAVRDLDDLVEGLGSPLTVNHGSARAKTDRHGTADNIFVFEEDKGKNRRSVSVRS